MTCTSVLGSVSGIVPAIIILPGSLTHTGYIFTKGVITDKGCYTNIEYLALRATV